MSNGLTWFANRGTGVVLLVLFTFAVVGGIAATRGVARPKSRRVPAYVTVSLHRTIALLAAALLVVHVATAVVDDYVEIGWIDAVVPFVGSYRPLYLGLGTLALDLTLAVVLTALVRHRLPQRLWRGVHLMAYPSWALAMWHTVGIGTDSDTPWGRALLAGSLGLVLAAVVARLVAGPRAGSPAASAVSPR